ncbi:MAG: insulinase family protein [Chlorobi bacterium]|nr:insulinase family protein [Chlorobiota bacterium]
MKRRSVLPTLIILLMAVTSYTSGQKLPEIKFEKYTLANGLQVILHVNKKIPAVNVNLWYHVGSKNEKPGRTGFAHLFEHMMFQGSKNVKGEYLSLAEKAGANLRTGGVNGTTNRDRTNYFETVPTSSLEFALWLESDRMGYLLDAMTEEKLDNQRDVVKNEKRQGDNFPYSVAQYLIAENLYPAGHPYAHTVIGSIDDLTAATLDDVKDFFKTWYTPNNATLILSGDFDPVKAKKLIKQYFGPIPAGPPLSRPGVDIPELPRNKQVFATDRVPQARLYLVYPTPERYSPEESRLDYAAAVLGQGKNSRLYKRLVRELELATSVSANNSCSEISGEFTITVTARPGKSLEKILEVVDEEIAKLAKDGITKNELEREKAQWEMRFISNLERIGGFGGIADRLGGYNTFLGDPDFFQKDFDRYQKVTPAEISREFNKWIADAHRLEVYITPEKGGRPDVKDFDRSIPPPIKDDFEFHAPKVQRRTLPNGLEVVVVERHELPLVTSQLIIKSGNLLETEDNAGESSLTAAMMDEGTKHRTALQIQDDLKKLGSSLSVSGSKHGSSMSCLKRRLDPTMEIFADVLLNPTFPKDELERLRKQTLDRIKQQKANPSAIASRIFVKELFGATHPLGLPSQGTENSIPKLTAQQLRKNYLTYWRPNNAAIVFVGDITLGEALTAVKKYLGSWKQAAVPEQKLPAFSAPEERVVYLVDRQGAPQSQIRIGSTAPDRYSKDYRSIQVMNAILGGAFSSRLNLNLREDKGYTYGAFSFFSMNRGYGYWMATAGVQTKFTKPSLVEFRKELEGITGKIPIKPEELDQTKKNLTRGYVQNFESNSMVLGQIAPLISYGLPISEIEDYIPAVKKETPESILETARKYVDFDHCLIIVVGDLEKIGNDVRSLGWGKVVVVDEDGNPVK